MYKEVKVFCEICNKYRVWCGLRNAVDVNTLLASAEKAYRKENECKHKLMQETYQAKEKRSKSHV